MLFCRQNGDLAPSYSRSDGWWLNVARRCYSLGRLLIAGMAVTGGAGEERGYTPGAAVAMYLSLCTEGRSGSGVYDLK